MTFLLVLVFLVLLILVYIMWVRPLLEKMGWVGPILWHGEDVVGRMKAFIRSSWTNAWNLLWSLIASAAFFSQSIIDWLTGDPNAKTTVGQLLADYPKTAAGLFAGVTIISIVLRNRTARGP